MQNEDLFDYSNATVEEIMVHVSGKPLAELQQIPFYKEAYDRTAILYGKTTYEKEEGHKELVKMYEDIAEHATA